jgi:hypothetical protein
MSRDNTKCGGRSTNNAPHTLTLLLHLNRDSGSDLSDSDAYSAFKKLPNITGK